MTDSYQGFIDMANKPLHELVHEAALEYSSKIAVTFYGGTETGASHTYKELVCLGDELTNLLQIHNVQNEHITGLYCHPNINIPNWILGILQLPAAYVPLDPDTPPTLTLRIIERCDLTFCVIQSELLQRFQSAFSSLLAIEVCAVWSTQNLTLVRIQWEQPSPQATEGTLEEQVTVLWQGGQRKGKRLHPDTPAMAAVTQSSHQGEPLAYVLHTSGTTGLPKIVRVPHRCIVPNIIHLRSLFQMTADDVVFLASPLTFDPSVVEMFLALSSGARLLVVPTAIKRMPSRLAQVLFKHHRTTVLQATPTLLGRFGRRVLQREVLSAGSSLRVLALGGEACPSPALLRSWRQEGNGTLVFNLYGTTEVSCWASCHQVTESLLHTADTMVTSVPLGTPLMGTVLEVRDESGCLVTEGEGQLFIGGQDRVCLLDDEVTALPGTMRATGDWVQVQDAHLYYLGRRDRLVKRHGQRLHLDALQQVLEGLPQVEACVVGMCEGRRLVAFVVPSTGNPKALLGPTSKDHHGDHAPASIDVQRDSALSSTDFQDDSTHSSIDGQRDHAPSSKTLERKVLFRLSQLLPNHSVPDTVVLVPSLPLTSHGKVAMGELMKMYERRREARDEHRAWGNMETLRERLPALWKDTLGLEEDAAIQADAHFLLSGGDSLLALRFCDDITVAMGTISPGLLEVILDGSFSDILNHIATVTLSPERGLVPKRSARRRREDPPSAAPPKRGLTDQTFTMTAEGTVGSVVPTARKTMGFVVVRRAGEVVELGQSHASLSPVGTNESTRSDQAHIKGANVNTGHSPSPIARASEIAEYTSSVKAETNESVEHTASTKATSRDTLTSRPGNRVQRAETVGDVCQSALQTGTLVDTCSLDLRVLWSSDTGRCVDASPVLLVESGADQARGRRKVTVFIGSHSHRVQALDLTSREVRWERILGGRLESSAAISKCGNLVMLGCYDGQVYFLRVDSGETWWVFETGDAVKSCPAVDPLTGLVMVGSHDGHIYALEPQIKRCVWKHHCGGGAVFSSPCLHPSPRQLYVATLRGCLACLKPDSGAPLWTHSTDVPFFSSPACSSSCVSVGSVDGNIYGFSHMGDMLWQFPTNGPVFSSPCIASPPLSNQRTVRGSRDRVASASLTNQRVVCGSHDGCVYCLNSADGSLLWRFRTTGKVFSSPFVFDGSRWGGGALVAVASTDGTVWVLDGADGTLRASLSLPGELFSSPVVWERTLVVGCRNDYVYCLELTDGRESQPDS